MYFSPNHRKLPTELYKYHKKNNTSVKPKVFFYQKLNNTLWCLLSELELAKLRI